MMRSIVVPPSLVPGFKVFINLDGAVSDGILKRVLATKVLARDNDLKDLLVSSGLGEEKAASLAAFLLGAATLMLQIGEDSTGLTKGITTGLPRWKSSALSPSELGQWTQISGKFQSLLGSECLYLLAKATQLAYDYDRVLDSCKLVTEIRPVFSKSDEHFPLVVVSQVLYLSYAEGEEDRTMAIVLDKEDIEDLKRSCERALTKLRVVQAQMQAAQIAVSIAGNNTNG